LIQNYNEYKKQLRNNQKQNCIHKTKSNDDDNITSELNYGMAKLDKVTGNISLTSIIRHVTNQVAQILTLQHFNIQESKGYGHAWRIVLEEIITGQQKTM
jgi:hypothetical protein